MTPPMITLNVHTTPGITVRPFPADGVEQSSTPHPPFVAVVLGGGAQLFVSDLETADELVAAATAARDLIASWQAAGTL